MHIAIITRRGKVTLLLSVVLGVLVASFWQLQGVTGSASSTDLYYVPLPTGCLNVREYGASTDLSDNLTAFDRAITAARATPEKCLYIPSGNYRHSDVIYTLGVSLYGENPNTSILTATNPDRAAIWDRVGSTIANIGFTSTHESVHAGRPAEDFIFFASAANFRVQNNRFFSPANRTVEDGYGAVAVKMRMSNNGKVIGNYIDNMGSASIYISGSAQTNTIEVAHNTIRRLGDDGICVESRDDMGSLPHSIHIHNNLIEDSVWGRGIALLGLKQSLIEHNTIRNTASAGVLVAAETSWRNLPSSDITITANIVENAGTIVKHPAFYLKVDRQDMWIDAVRLTNNIARNNANGNFLQKGDVRNVTLTNNTGF